jgi:hypothetical protein
VKPLKKIVEWMGGPAAAAAPTRDPKTDLDPADVERILAEVPPLTMVDPRAVRFTVEQTAGVIRSGIPGVLVECGVWRGGASLAMLRAQQAACGKVERRVYMLDSFEGLPPVTGRDGPLAARWQQGADPANYLDNCRASREALECALRERGFSPEDFRIVPGWFAQTLPPLAKELAAARIALLRLDGDWYESTLVCLEQLVPLVSEGGVVIVDDYYAWDGCARAVHDYLSRHDLAYRIRSLPGWQGAWFIKQAHRDRFDVL